jgi:SAM-dependent methyltransferase
MSPPPAPDALRPTPEAALAAWAARVRADREQVERCREVEDPADFYAPVAQRFAQDPARTDEPVLGILLSLARPGERWLDIGSGGGRYALPLARHGVLITAVDPSPAMLEVLREGMQRHGLAGIDILEGRWPNLAPPLPTADVALMAHVGYDIEAIGPFLQAAEACARRRCVAVVGEGAMTTAAALLWEPIHGEPRVALPALPELITLLLARGCLPAVSLAERQPPAMASLEELIEATRRQLWVRTGSAKDGRLVALVTQQATQREPGWALDWRPTRIGIVSWEPAGRPRPSAGPGRGAGVVPDA